LLSVLSPAMGRVLQRFETPTQIAKHLSELSTPEKKHSGRSTISPCAPGQKQADEARNVLSTAKNVAKCNNTDKCEPLSWGPEHDALDILFAGIDRVSQIYVSRNRRIDFSMLRHDVEVNTRKELSEVRLGQILALAAGGLKAHWIGSGNAAKLELLQLDEAGQEQAMTTADIAARKTKFKEALKAAVDTGEVPFQNIPPKPESTENQICRLLNDSRELSAPVPDLTILPRATIEASAASKMQSTLDRVRARQAAAQSPEALKYQELRRDLQTCTDSMEAFSVMAGLFARREGATDSEFVKCADAASEQEVLKALCSGMVLRPMDAMAARAAVAYLASKASGWFDVEEGKHVVGAKYYKRLPNSSPANVLDRLKVERSNIEEQLRSMTGANRMLQVASVAPTNAVVHKAVATCTSTTVGRSPAGKRSSQPQKHSSLPRAPDAKRRRVSVKQRPPAAW